MFQKSLLSVVVNLLRKREAIKRLAKNAGFALLLLAFAVGWLATSNANADNSNPPQPNQPNVIPLTLNVSPSGQTVSASPWHASWSFSFDGQLGSYCIYVDWGDAFPDWSSCGYSVGPVYHTSHDFNHAGNGAGTYNQVWRGTGPGGTSYKNTYVIKK